MPFRPLLFLALAGAAASLNAAPTPPAIDAAAYILIAQKSGQVLAEHEADARLDPASLTKLMTSLVTFQALRAGTLTLDELVTVSERAWRTGGSRTFVDVGSQVRVEDLLKGMIIQSGNDASVALAERIAGTEEAFAALMNEEAKRLGLENTIFDNATGLPGSGHYASARDLALIASTIISEFAEYYYLFSQREYTYNGITQYNRNPLLWKDPLADGLKTGHTDTARYCLAASAERDGMRLVAVVLGSTTDKTRAAGGRALLDYGFNSFETHRLYAGGTEITRAKVWRGATDDVALGLESDLYLTIPRGQYEDLVASVDLPIQVVAPLDEHVDIGLVRVVLGDETLVERPLRTLVAVSQGSWLKRMADNFALWLE
jgi:D-alanyl-D-alanine carboxypeptidase (penicillin-binding protein 5/6)